MFGRITARQRLRKAARESLKIPAFSSPVDCTPWVLGGLWPAELSTVTAETAALADYLKADLQRIAESANKELRTIRLSRMADPARQAAEARVINRARTFAARRVESAIRHLRASPQELPQELPGQTPVSSGDGVAAPDFSNAHRLPAAGPDRPRVAPQQRTTPVAEPQALQQSTGNKRGAHGSADTLTAQPAQPPAGEPTTAQHRQPAVDETAASEPPTEEVPVTRLEPRFDMVSRPQPGEPAVAEPRVAIPPPTGHGGAAVADAAAADRLEIRAPEATTEELPTAGYWRLPGGETPTSESAAGQAGPASTQTPEVRYAKPAPHRVPGPWDEASSAADVPVTWHSDTYAGDSLNHRQPRAEPESRRERLQRLLEFVARQEPGLRWAVGDREDGTTILVTDLAYGWIPPGIALPADVCLLEPGRHRGNAGVLLGHAEISATYAPGDSLGRPPEFEVTESSLKPRELPPVNDLGWLLSEATHWRDGLPRIVHTLAKAGAAGTGVVDVELDVLRVHLEIVRYQLLAQYPDVDAALLLNCLLLAATEGIATGDRVSANYHFAWFQALSAPPASKWPADS